MEFLQPWIPHLATLGGLLIGIALASFIWRGKLRVQRARFEERAKGAERSIVDLEAGCANLETEVRQLRHSEALSLKRQAELEVLVKTQQKTVEEKQQLLREAEQQLAQHFKTLSSEALHTTKEEFLQLARSTFDSQQREATSELEQRRIAVETLVRPVAATLEKVETRIGELEKARQEAEARLQAQIREMASAQVGLQKETAHLVRAIRQPAGRGRWGEIQLKRVVELAGMQPYCDFLKSTGESPAGAPPRPDLIVKLPTGRQVAVDARAPLEAGLAAMEAADEATRHEALQRHAASLSSHLAELASRDYLAQFRKRPEFVVLFLPSESFLSAALSEDASLMERGLEQGVILATPTTLVALLRAAAVGWQQEGIAEQARNVSSVGRELHQRVTTLADHMARVGRSLDATVRNYNDTVGSLEGSVVPTARKLSDLGVVPATSELPASPVIERSVRQPRGDLSNLPVTDPSPAGEDDPDQDFEGFAVPNLEVGPSPEGDPGAQPRKTEPARIPSDRPKHKVKMRVHGLGSRQAAPSSEASSQRPNPEAAAGDLRAALNNENQ